MPALRCGDESSGDGESWDALAVPQDPLGQIGYGVRFDWGAVGAARAGERTGVLVVVDVLSFTTAVTVAVERGVAVNPAAWRVTADAGGSTDGRRCATFPPG
jgi:hypothetical protein